MQKPSEWIEMMYEAKRQAEGGSPSPAVGRTEAIIKMLDMLAEALPPGMSMQRLRHAMRQPQQTSNGVTVIIPDNCDLHLGPGAELGLRAELAEVRAQLQTEKAEFARVSQLAGERGKELIARAELIRSLRLAVTRVEEQRDSAIRDRKIAWKAVRDIQQACSNIEEGCSNEGEES